MVARFIAWGFSASLSIFACSKTDRVYTSAGEGGAAGQSEQGVGGDEAPGEAMAGDGVGAGSTGGAGGAGGDGSLLPPQLGCTDTQLLDVGSKLFSGSTRQAGDDFSATCFSGKGNDVTVEWVAPDSDYFRFTTAGSSYDTALALFDNDCEGAELACNSDPNVPQVEIVELVEKGERVVIVVDGKAGASGDVVVGIERIGCPGLNLTDQVLPIELSTQNQGDNSAACGGGGKSDRAMRFTPPEDGLYRFSATSDDFDPIVSVEDGPTCGGGVLGCGYSRKGDHAEVVRKLKQGEPVTVLVDGGGGTFELDIQDISGSASCPGDEPTLLLDGSLIVVNGSFVGAEHLLSASCAPTADFNPTAAYEPLVERSYPVSVNLPPDMSCQLQVMSEYALVVYLLAGDDCAGRELKCAKSLGGASNNLSFTSADNGDYVLVVEDDGGHRKTFEISMSCIL